MSQHRKPTRLKMLRIGRGMSQWDVAERVGISQAKYSEWERGQRVPSGTERPKLARALGVPVTEIPEVAS